MSKLVDAIENITGEVMKDPESESHLQDLRKEIAESYIQKLEKKNPDLFLLLGKDLVVDYLVDDRFMDSIHDVLVEQTLGILSDHTSDLKNFREKLNNATTEEALSTLKSEIHDDKVELSWITSKTDTLWYTKTVWSTETSFSWDVLQEFPPNIDISQGAESFYHQLKGKEKMDMEPFALAFRGYEKLKSELKNPRYLTVVDFSKSNKEERMFVINMETKNVDYSLTVGHGKNSWGEYAKTFSDQMGSNQSSLGFYRTPAEITKAHTKSWHGLWMNGIENSNDNAKDRGIYMHPGGLKSQGCFTLQMSQQEANKIMDKLKGDSLLFAYYPDSQYIASSKILWGDSKNLGRSVA